MRLNYITPQPVATMQDIQSACSNFFYQHKILPDTVKMSYFDMSQLMGHLHSGIQSLERGKDYGLFVTIPGGMVELIVLEENNEVTINMSSTTTTTIVVESTQIDREFEKHILNKDNNG